MSNRLSAFILLFLLLGGATFFSATLRAPLLSLLQTVNGAWIDLTSAVADRYHEHFYQRDMIRKLRSEVELYRKAHLVSHEMAIEFNALLAENNASFHYDPRVALVRAVSYANFGDINKVWLRMDDFNASRLYGLIYNEKAAGIVTERDGRPLALLNGDYQCTYSVFIGPDKAPGIIRGQNSNRMLVQYIPTWVSISVGDEVTTSGLDRLFFAGIKVGVVRSISLTGGYQSAIVEPYYTGTDPDYFHVITRVR